MKSKHLTVTFFIASAFFLFKGQSAQAQTEFGVKGGVLLSGINKPYNGITFDFEKRTGFAAGIFFRRSKLLGPLGLQTELLYQLKGGDVYILHHCNTNSNGSGGYTFGYGYFNPAAAPWMRNHQKYPYLSMPLLLTVSPVRFADVYAGPEAGYLLSVPASVIGRNKPARFSAAVTGGIALKISSATKLDIRYSEDLTPVNDFGDSNIKNYSFTIGLQQTLFRRSD